MKWAIGTAFVVSLFALGCTQGTPTIAATEDLPPIILDHDRFESKNLSLYDISLTGQISKFVQHLEVSFDGGNSWTQMENGAQASLQLNIASCATNCAFSYALNDVGTKWPVLMQLATDEEKEGLVRGYSLYGYTQPTKFYVKKLKRGFVSIGSIGLNGMGDSSKKLTTAGLSGFRVVGGRLESRKIGTGTFGSDVYRNQGVIR